MEGYDRPFVDLRIALFAQETRLSFASRSRWYIILNFQELTGLPRFAKFILSGRNNPTLNKPSYILQARCVGSRSKSRIVLFVALLRLLKSWCLDAHSDWPGMTA